MNKITQTEDLVISDLNISSRVAEIEEQGYTVIHDFISQDEIARIRHAFMTEVPITEVIIALVLGLTGVTRLTF